ncbi:ATP-binding protein [Marinobacter changyiensis]|uniref:ATP-binding protein n=1 Tax=Marinobacter changyiensis TaxID=2604091 RepID=UPI0012658052|nr:ATP-binding protein [Marinobacter changyiensis]
MTPTNRGRRSLSRQLLWLGALPAIVMFLVLMTFFTSARLDDARKDIYNSSQVLADNLGPAVEYAVVSGNEQALDQILQQSMRRSDVEWIRVVDVMGNQVGFASRENGDEAVEVENRVQIFESEILQQPLTMQSDDRIDWLEPDYNLGSGALRVGTVEVGVSDRRLEVRRSDIIWSSLGLGMALLVFTLLVVNQMLTRIIEPVRGLSKRVQDLMRREYHPTQISHRGTSAEFVELERNLNALSEHLANLKVSRDQTLAISENARERAETANLAKSEFLAVMSHELRTPLNGVLAMLELVTEEPLTDRQRDYLTTARRSTEDLLTVISDILDFSRVDRGKLVLDFQKFDLRELIVNCTATFRHPADQQGLTLAAHFEGLWPQPAALVRGDAPRLRQVIACLLDNAIKFTDEGDVTITSEWVTLEDGCMILNCEVKDSGAGIPSERMKEMFNSFEQLDSSHSRQHGGTGIGLALVQRLVELMGGHIRVETDLGMGSSFRFELPFEIAESIDAPPARKILLPEPAPAPEHRSPARALVVEDNPVNQRVATALLTRLGFETDAVDNGQQALDRVRANQDNYEVILMDCHMPVMDGFEATRSIREWEVATGLRFTPIIALTADALPDTEAACHEAGMNDYLAKPVRKENLRTVLSRWLHL